MNLVKGLAFSLLFSIATLIGAEPATSYPVFPSPVIPPPKPPEKNTNLLNLEIGTLLVVNSKVDGSVRDYPKGLVKLTHKKGPRDISAKFIDNPLVIEDRTYDGPFLWVIEPLNGQKGVVVLELIPYGYKADKEIVSTTINVNGGEGVQPNPDVDPKPNPNPKPDDNVVPAPGASLFVVVLVDKLNIDPNSATALSSTSFRKYLGDNKHELEIIDTGTQNGQTRYTTDYKELLDARKIAPPCVVLMNATPGNQLGRVLKTFTLPKTDTDIMTAIKSVTGK